MVLQKKSWGKVFQQLSSLFICGSHSSEKTRIRAKFKILAAVLFRHRQCERPERFPVFHVLVQIFLHIGRPGRCEQAAIAESSRTELGRSLVPSDDFTRLQQEESL